MATRSGGDGAWAPESFLKAVTDVAQVTAKSGEGFAELTVSDNGIGIAKERQKAVFDMFKRLHAFSDIEGNGLGLAVCQRIATMHKTSIELVSSPGNGASFSMKLPLAR